MNGILIDRYRRWFDYEKDSHAKTLDSLNAVAEALRQSEGFGKAVYLLGHLVAARRMWLFRLGVLREDTDLFTREISLAELPEQIAEMERLWSEYLSQLKDIDLERVFEYQSYEGQRFRNSIEDILTQMFGHSWYHRGQIALLLRSIGAEPAVTDIVFWTREPVDPSPNH
ncbi:MAG: DinB family protein [Pyrinomonadaceae bacterium]|nr:DinB family protein [Pyrinomonadaceae bacterium]